MNLKPGDVVMLKSGGQPLTVVEVGEDSVECVWMGAEGELFRDTLPRIVLDRIDEDPLAEDDEEEDGEDDETDKEEEEAA